MQCKRCGHERPGGKRCAVCKKRYNKSYYKKHGDQLALTSRNRSRGYRDDVLKAYGGRCKCCDESRPEFLVIDHIHGGGNCHREKLFGRKNYGGHGFYVWLRKQGFPADYRILCHNCNAARGLYGYCPHEREREGMACRSMSIT